MKLDQAFWKDKYKQQQTGWDIGYASPPIISYFDQVETKDIKILIPGCGNAHEASSLFKMGFTNVYILDIVEETLHRFAEKTADFPKSQILCGDFFNLKGQFDIIIEQTFFCALLPDHRNEYVSKMKSLLKTGAKLVGVFFDIEFETQGPPFGGTKKEYEKLFSSSFTIKTLEKCYNSIPPRMGNELFFIFEAH